MKTLLAACLVFAWQTGPAHADAGNGPTPDVVLGNDISWPQCGGRLPAPPEFAVVGVNGGRPGTVNPCLAEQLAWADRTSEAAGGTPAAVYVNTAAPGPEGTLWWPEDNTYRGMVITNPYGTCDGAASVACAYVHGYAMAVADVAILKEAGDTAVRPMWWLDVEFGNSWPWDKAVNVAELEGMTAYLEGTGAEVGIYSTGYQFGEIVGDIPPGSNLYKLRNWLAGADSVSSAQEHCAAAPLTGGGTVSLTQFTENNLDYNYRCPAAAPVPAPVPVPEPVPRPDPQPGKARLDLYSRLQAAQIA
ncbi:MAG: hypothetical protein ACLGH7_02905 [Actinomycetes bacterium]